MEQFREAILEPMPDFDFQNYLQSLRDYYGGYHDHKENVAFTAATLYMAPMVTITVIPVPLIASLPGLAALLVSTFVVYRFVSWQLAGRAFARNVGIGANQALTDIMQNGAKADVTPALFDNRSFPKTLVDAITTAKAKKYPTDLWEGVWLLFLPLFLSGAFAFARHFVIWKTSS